MGGTCQRPDRETTHGSTGTKLDPCFGAVVGSGHEAHQLFVPFCVQLAQPVRRDRDKVSRAPEPGRLTSGIFGQHVRQYFFAVEQFLPTLFEILLLLDVPWSVRSELVHDLPGQIGKAISDILRESDLHYFRI